LRKRAGRKPPPRQTAEQPPPLKKAKIAPRVVDAPVTFDRQIIRQLARAARGAGSCFSCRFRCNGFSLGFLDRLRLLEVLDGEFKLFNKLLAAFRGSSELFSPQLRQHQFQALDFEPPNFDLALRKRQGFLLREDHRVGTGKISGE